MVRTEADYNDCALASSRSPLRLKDSATLQNQVLVPLSLRQWQCRAQRQEGRAPDMEDMV